MRSVVITGPDATRSPRSWGPLPASVVTANPPRTATDEEDPAVAVHKPAVAECAVVPVCAIPTSTVPAGDTGGADSSTAAQAGATHAAGIATPAKPQSCRVRHCVESVIGGYKDDVLTGSAGADELNGGEGVDTLRGLGPGHVVPVVVVLDEVRGVAIVALSVGKDPSQLLVLVNPVVADTQIRSVDRVAIGAGAHGANLHVAAEDLIRTLGASVVDVTKPDEA